MLKKIITSSVLIASVGLLFSGCNDFDGKYHKIVEFEPKKNFVVVEYRSDKIAHGYFKDKINDYCKEYNRVASLNSIKTIDSVTEQASFSCVIDD